MAAPAAAAAVARAAPRLLRPTLSAASSPSQSLSQSLRALASETATPLTVRDLRCVGTRADVADARLESARWLHGELPVRLAHRVVELGELPYGLAEMPSVVQVRDMYTRSFAEIYESRRPDGYGEAEDFTKMLGRVRDRHEDVIKLVAKGVLELKEECGRCPSDMEIRSFLDRFYMSRISIRVLLSHHLALGVEKPGYAGIISQKCCPAELARDAIDATRNLAYAHYGEAPEVTVEGNVGFTFPYIERHVYFCLFELLKNSLRATVEKHRDAAVLPPVRVVIADGAEDLSIKISDEGGGFRRSQLDRVWTYLFTTGKIPAQQLLRIEECGKADNSGRPDPIAGFGYGLPLSRLYSRYFGGDLTITSMHGHGTDAYLHLSVLGEECLL